MIMVYPNDTPSEKYPFDDLPHVFSYVWSRRNSHSHSHSHSHTDTQTHAPNKHTNTETPYTRTQTLVHGKTAVSIFSVYGTIDTHARAQICSIDVYCVCMWLFISARDRVKKTERKKNERQQQKEWMYERASEGTRLWTNERTKSWARTYAINHFHIHTADDCLDLLHWLFILLSIATYAHYIAAHIAVQSNKEKSDEVTAHNVSGCVCVC